MKFEYASPELEITLFATEIIMDSATGGIEEVPDNPSDFDGNNFLD